MQHGGVEIMDAHPVFHGFVAQIIGGAMSDSPFHSTPRHPEAKAAGAMISPGRSGIVSNLRKWHPPKLTSPK